MPLVAEMQSEGGAAGAIHGALQTGALSTTFTASQGLLLMIPNMYKIAGELTPVVFHVAVRSLATQALSIFGDHSDVMATRATGFALLASNSVQEAQDLALIAHASTLEARVPFLHFFDGFRTSHEIDKIEQVSREDMRAMIDDRFVQAHRQRALSQEFTPAMVKGIFDEMCKAEPKRRFTVGIHDDVTSTSLDYDPTFSTELAETVRCLFWGLGSDGTVGANKNSIKIIDAESVHRS